MQTISKQEAVDVIKDALEDTSPYGQGVVSGLCGAFHMCGVISKDEMDFLLADIECFKENLN